MDSLVAATVLCRDIGRSSVLREEWGARELYPGPDVGEVVGDPELREYLRRTVTTYHHQSGTCKMGVDADAVVDPQLRVYGIDGLRVADASVFPAITTGNVHAPALMVGEQVSRFIAADHGTAWAA